MNTFFGVHPRKSTVKKAQVPAMWHPCITNVSCLLAALSVKKLFPSSVNDEINQSGHISNTDDAVLVTISGIEINL